MKPGSIRLGSIKLWSILGALAGLVLTSGVAAASEKPPAILERSSKWYVNYDDDSCTLAAEFGTTDRKIMTRYTWFEPDDWFQLILVGTKLPGNTTSSAVSLTFGPDGKPQQKQSMNGTSGKLPMLVVVSARLDGWDRNGNSEVQAPAVTPDQEKAVQWLDLRINGGVRYRLAVQSMGPVMAAIRTCEAQLVKSWGFDPAVQASLTRKPTPLKSPETWLSSTDYPVPALSQGANGIVRFRLDVGSDGLVGGCHVMRDVRSPDFEKITCDLIRRRARFMPALDAQGRPAASFYVNTVRWQMQGS